MVVVLLAPGDVFNGYVVERVLPSEGEIQKYLVKAADGAELVLYCRIKKKASPEETEEFHKRAEVLKALTHPQLPRVDRTGYARDLFYWIATEAPQGKSLREVMDEKPEWATPDAFLLLLYGIATVMHAALTQGLVHFGLTPSHIYISEEDHDLVAVTGLGIRMTLDASPRPPAREDLVYRAPEQMRRHDADYRADIFAVGMIAYELFSGEPPYADNLREIGVTDIRKASEITIDALRSVNPTRISEKVPGIDSAVEKLITKMIQKSPANRMATWEHVMAGVTHAGASFAAALLMARSEDQQEIDRTLIERGAPTIREIIAMFEPPDEGARAPKEEIRLSPSDIKLLPAGPSPSNDPVVVRPKRWARIVGLGAAVAAAVGVGLRMLAPPAVEVARTLPLQIVPPIVVEVPKLIMDSAPAPTPVKPPEPAPGPIQAPVRALYEANREPQPPAQPEEVAQAREIVPAPSEPENMRAKAGPEKPMRWSKEMLFRLWKK